MSAQRIGIIGGSPMWRRGVGAVLSEAGYSPAESASLSDWRPGRGGLPVILHVKSGPDLEQITDFVADHPHVPVVVVSSLLGIAEYAAIVKAGGFSAVAEDEPVDTVVAVLEHAMAGRSSAPPTIMRALAGRVAAGFGEVLRIEEVDVARLRALAAGSTVAQLAQNSDYSEREMFRMLSELYVQIGVANRTDAIVWASRHGLLDDDPPT